MKIEEIAEVTGLSKSYASEIRRGIKTPHPRHWFALATLAANRWEHAEQQPNLEEKFADVDFDDDILPLVADYTLQDVSEATGLPPSYVGEIRRAEKVPNLERWDQFLQLLD